MARPSPSATMAAVLLAIVGPAPAADVGPSLARARDLLARRDGRAAAPILEAALAESPADGRPALLSELRRAYESAALQADADGKAREAREYRENLGILNRKLAKVKDLQPGGLDPDRARAESTTGPLSVEIKAPLAPKPPGPAPRAAHGPAGDPTSGMAPPVALPEPERLPPPDAPPARRPDPPALSEGPRTESPKSQPTKGLAVPPALLAVGAADDAFRAGRFDEAGRGYADLAKEGRLPAARRDHWAYCRMVDVVKRINAPPTSPDEWTALHAEIERIRTLSPKNWFGEYLRNLVSQRSGPARASSPGAVVLRGAAPDEPSGTARRRRPPDPVKLASVAAAAPDVAPEPAATPVPTQDRAEGNWQVRETTNFRIYHNDKDLADRVSRLAEATRETQGRRWLGDGPRPAWSPRCDIYLYPTASAFSRMTGQPEESPGFSILGQNLGRISSRRINLRADHPNVATAVLPHELTHVVLADLFPIKPIPRWADEGLAVLAEPASEQGNRARDLVEPLKTGRLFPVERLVSIDCPDGPYWGLYYAQSVSLTRFLVEQGTPAQFVRFLQGAERNGVEAELRRVYKIEGLADLQGRWLAYAKSVPDASTASGAEVERR